VLRFNEKGFERGTLVLGTQPAKLPQQAILNIEGNTGTLSVSKWLKQLTAKQPKSEHSPFTIHHSPFTIHTDLYFEHLELFGQSFTKVMLQAKYANRQLQAAITSTGIEGQITFKQSKNKPSLDLSFRKLALTVPQTQKRPKKPPVKGKPQPPPDPRNLPQVSFYCGSLQIGGTNLGEVDLHSQPTHDGLKVKLTSYADGLKLRATGQWRYVVQRHQTLLQATINSKNTGLMLQQFGYPNPPIIGRTSQITIKGYWQDAPYNFNLSKPVGTLSLIAMEGRIVAVDPGPIGRLFGLFDVYTLPQRLALDFSDMFDHGFSFNTIAGVFFIKNGIARTDHLILRAPSAQIEISGQTNLVKKNYDQIVTVFPHLSNPLPVASALAGGIGIGVAALIAQQLLQRELENIIKSDYHITGSWEKPKIVRLPMSNEKLN